MTVIDVHAHAFMAGIPPLIAERPELADERQQLLATFGRASMDRNAELGAGPWRTGLTDLATRLAAMDDAGIDLQLVSPSPAQYHPWADEQLAGQLTASANATLGALVDSAPTRLRALGYVPLQHPALAAAELERLMQDDRFVGAEIGTTAGDRDFSHDELSAFWSMAHATGALLFLHPWGCSLGSRLERYYLGNVVGNPTETTVALHHLVFGGVFDRYPGLRVVAAHGGGYFPHALGRADHAWRNRPESRTSLRPPSEYRDSVLYDSVLHDPRELAALVAAVGADRVVLGTDYPFDMAVDDPLALLAKAGLDDAQITSIGGGTLAALLERNP